MYLVALEHGDRAFVRDLRVAGFEVISRRYRDVARLPDGFGWLGQCLDGRSREWSWSAANYQRRVEATREERRTLTVAQFQLFLEARREQPCIYTGPSKPSSAESVFWGEEKL